jgi:hypothetical protein
MINPIITLNPIFSGMVKPGNPLDRVASLRAQREGAARLQSSDTGGMQVHA